MTLTQLLGILCLGAALGFAVWWLVRNDERWDAKRRRRRHA